VPSFLPSSFCSSILLVGVAVGAGGGPGEGENKEETTSSFSGRRTFDILLRTPIWDSGFASGSSSTGNLYRHHHRSSQPLSPYTRELDFHHPFGPILQFRPTPGNQLPVFSFAMTLARRKRAELEDERRTPVSTRSKKDLTGGPRRVEVEISYEESVDSHILRL
jgi:hypothetical protein